MIRRLAVLFALALAAALAAPAGAQARSSYCSPSGDYCQYVYERGGERYLELRTFSFRGTVDVCVARRTNVCRETRLRESKGGVYVSRISWNDRYPRQGSGTYRVRWLLDGTRIGAVLSFRR